MPLRPLHLINEFLGDGSAPKRDRNAMDLERLYRQLEKSGTMPWQIERSVYCKASLDKGLRRVATPGATSTADVRESFVWDTRNDPPFEWRHRFDLICMRRGMCFCDGQSTCAGVTEEGGKGFIERIVSSLKPSGNSAAYLGGWNAGYRLEKLKRLVASAGMGQVTMRKDGSSSGVFISKGRPFPRVAMEAPYLPVGHRASGRARSRPPSHGV